MNEPITNHKRVALLNNPWGEKPNLNSICPKWTTVKGRNNPGGRGSEVAARNNPLVKEKVKYGKANKNKTPEERLAIKLKKYEAARAEEDQRIAAFSVPELVWNIFNNYSLKERCLLRYERMVRAGQILNMEAVYL